jgi:hypothetical protein
MGAGMQKSLVFMTQMTVIEDASIVINYANHNK